MHHHKVRVSERVKAYKIGTEVYLQDGEQIYCLDEFSATDQQLLELLLEGCVPELVVPQLLPQQQARWQQLMSLLQKAFLLEQQTCADETVVAKVRSVGIYCADVKLFAELSKHFDTLQLGSEHNPSALSWDVAVWIKTPSQSQKQVLEWNHRCCQEGKVWLFADLSPTNYACFGPFVCLPETACYQCFCMRCQINGDLLTQHSAMEQQLLRQGVSDFRSWQTSFVASMIAHEIAGFVRHRRPATLRFVRYLDLDSLETWQEGILRYPQCNVCRRGQYAFI